MTDLVKTRISVSGAGVVQLADSLYALSPCCGKTMTFVEGSTVAGGTVWSPSYWKCNSYGGCAVRWNDKDFVPPLWKGASVFKLEKDWLVSELITWVEDWTGWTSGVEFQLGLE